MPEQYENYKPGASDRFDKKISRIFTLIPEFIIYENDEGDLCHDHPSAKSLEYSKKFSSISSKMAIVKVLSIPSKHKLINTQVSEAWRESFNDQPDAANKILDGLIDKLLVSGKIKYILSALLVFIGLGIAAYYLTQYIAQSVESAEKYKIIKFGLLGAAGGLISILIKLKEIYLDPNSPFLNCIAGGSRIIISVASSIIFYFAYKAHIILSIFSDNAGNEIYYLYFCAFIFGFAERFIPEIANEVEDSIKIEKKNKTTTV